MIVFVC